MVGRILTFSLDLFGRFLFFVGAAGLVRRFGRNNPKILLYHDCAARETDYTADLECTTSPERFEKHLSYLQRHYRFVDLDTILSGRAPPNSVAITFDDGYASVYEHAFPVLKDKQAPATIYLISSVMDNRTLVWVNELNALLRRGGAAALQCVRRHFDIGDATSPAEVISFCRLHYRSDKMQALLEDVRRLLNAPVAEHAAEARLYLTWDQVRKMRSHGVVFGNHSRTHPNMACLSEDEQAAEIAGAQEELQAHLPSVRTFAHPFGHKGSTTAQLAAQAGLGSVVEVGGHNAPVSALRLGRTHLANESVAGLFARMEVIEPVKALLRRRLGARSHSSHEAAKSA